MTEDEKLKSIPDIKEKGNILFKEKNYNAACEMYAKGIGILEQLMLGEKPNEEEWLALNQLKTPLLLNYAQCKLIQEEYYAVIEHCTTVLKHNPDNVKALYKRGKAYIGVWNEEEAIKDLTRVVELDPTLQHIIEKELRVFSAAIKEKNQLEKKKLLKLFK